MSVRSTVLVALALLATSLPFATAADADSELAVTHPTFYVIAPGGDASVAPITSAVSARLQELFDRAPGAEKNRVWVIPRLGWSPDDLENQCKNDPTKDSPTGAKVLGGLILDGTNSYAGSSDSYLLWVRGSTKVSTQANLVSCAPLGFTVPTITWVSDDLHGYSARNGFAVGTGLATGLYFGAGQDSNTKSFALGATISGFDSTTSIPPVDPAREMHDAAHRAANDLMEKLAVSCSNGDDADIWPMCYRMGLTSRPPPAAPPSPKPSVQPSR
jgi:hypothetical protein